MVMVSTVSTPSEMRPRHGVDGEPEGDPGQHDDQDGRDVHLHHVVRDVPLQVEHRLDTAVVTCQAGQMSDIPHVHW